MRLTGSKIKLVRIFLSGAAVTLFLALTLFDVLANELHTFDSMSIQIGEQRHTLEIAKTSRQRQQGLMFRSNLDAQSGMLFVYPVTAHHRIWMKNTLIPLTVIWLDKAAIVVGIKQLRPCDADPCPSFGIDSPSRYVLELPANYSGLKLGDEVQGILNIK